MTNRVCQKTYFSQAWCPPKWNADVAKDTKRFSYGALLRNKKDRAGRGLWELSRYTRCRENYLGGSVAFGAAGLGAAGFGVVGRAAAPAAAGAGTPDCVL